MPYKAILRCLSLALAGPVAALADSLPPPPMLAYSAVYTPTCESRTVHIYFPIGEAFLTPQANQALEALKSDVLNCDLNALELRSITADGRSGAEMQALAQERLAMVEAAFDRSGLSPQAIVAHTETDGVQHDLTKPMQRRVAIHVDLQSRARRPS